MRLDYEIKQIGDSCISFVFGDTIDAQLNREVLGIYRHIKAHKSWGDLPVLDLVPTYRSLAVHLQPGSFRFSEAVEILQKAISEALEGQSDGESLFNDIIIPVDYSGPDMDRVAELNGMSREEVIKLHTAPAYQVAMVGFRPHFPYLIGLDSRLETARLDSPRTAIPAGSVAIGGAQTGVYPEPSPGGWNIIGSTDPELLKKVQPGDRILFRSESDL